jgi:hypothetical protein
MLRLFLAAGLSVIPATAGALVCRAPTVLLRITLEDEVCRVNDDVAVRREGGDGTECLLSDPRCGSSRSIPTGGSAIRTRTRMPSAKASAPQNDPGFPGPPGGENAYASAAASAAMSPIMKRVMPMSARSRSLIWSSSR